MKLRDIAHRQMNRARLMEMLAEIVEDDRAFVPEILAALQSEGALNGVARPRARRQKKTAFDRVLEWYAANDNHWVTIADLAKEAGLNTNTIQHMMFVNHAEDFEKRDSPDGSRAKQFRRKIQ